jgi:hypothetical protein
VLAIPEAAKRDVECAGQVVHARGNRLQAGRPVIHRIHRDNVRQERLRGADIRGRFLTADVLLARLQRHPVRRLAVRVDRHADDAPRHVAHGRLPGGEEGGMRPAESQRDTQPLRVAEDHVGAHFARRRHDGEREQIRRHRDERPGLVGPRDERPEVVEPSAFVGILDQRTERPRVEAHRVGRSHPQLDPQRFGAAPEHRDGLREAAVRHEEHSAIVAQLLRLQPVQQRHGLAGRGPFIQQRRVGHFHPGQIRDDGLEVEQRFEPALRDLRLVRRIRRIPARVLEQAPPDHARRQRVVITQADEAAQHAILAGNGLEAAQVLRFALGGRQSERRPEADAGGNGFVDQGVQRGSADRREHRFCR